jgi:hypothetical protein
VTKRFPKEELYGITSQIAGRLSRTIEHSGGEWEDIKQGVSELLSIAHGSLGGSRNADIDR